MGAPSLLQGAHEAPMTYQNFAELSTSGAAEKVATSLLATLAMATLCHHHQHPFFGHLCKDRCGPAATGDESHCMA